MPRSSPYTIKLTEEVRAVLQGRARKYTLPYRDVFRAQIVLLAADGLRNDEIARRLNTRREVVSLWRKRFYEEGLAGLEERSRRGRPAAFSPTDAGGGQAIACELPATLELPLSRLHVPDIRAEVIRRGIRWPRSRMPPSGAG